MRSVLEAAKDRPFLITALIMTLTGFHLMATAFGWVPNIWASLESSGADSIAIYLGLSAGAAILAGFAGVIVIHGLSVDTPRFRQFRLTAGTHLHANWASISSAGFLSAGIALAAAVFAVSSVSWAAPWLFQFALGCALHGTLRLLWLLHTFFKLQRDDDADKYAKETKRDLSSLFNRDVA